jgi:hypothetical protein
MAAAADAEDRPASEAVAAPVPTILANARLLII